MDKDRIAGQVLGVAMLVGILLDALVPSPPQATAPHTLVADAGTADAR